MGEHITPEGLFQSDKYKAWAQPGFLPLKLTDPMAQPLLWAYAQVRRQLDPAFAADLEQALMAAGYDVDRTTLPWWLVEFVQDEIVYVGILTYPTNSQPGVFAFGELWEMKFIVQAPTEADARALGTDLRKQRLAKEEAS